jgi:hypothetical protein
VPKINISVVKEKEKKNVPAAGDVLRLEPVLLPLLPSLLPW